MARFLRFSGASKEERLAARSSFIPKGARLVSGPAGGAVYSYDLAGKFYAIAFRGTAARSEWHHSFRTDEQRQRHIAEFHQSLTAHAAYRATQRAEKAAWTNPLQVGEILYTSWGYDQTNVEFFVVTKVSGRRVWVREIASDYEERAFMSGDCWPKMPIECIGEETMHTAQPCGERGARVKISDCRTAWQETGRSHNTTSYA